MFPSLTLRMSDAAKSLARDPFWAKTIDASGNNVPGISVRDHCLNVGCVAEKMLELVPARVRDIFPTGTVLLTALHDIGKITLGFQTKCDTWLHTAQFDETTRRQILQSVTDHALVSQWWLKPLLKQIGKNVDHWAIAVGAHHGKPKGRSPRVPFEALEAEASQWRQSVLEDLSSVLGPLPRTPPSPELEDSDLWLLAGLITVADWIGSNEQFFSPAQGQSVGETRRLAAAALNQIGWPGGKLSGSSFKSAFGFAPNPLQEALLSAASAPGLIVVEAPMGFGKTEAALAAAQRLIVAGDNHGIYFALPTQVTSNRIHQRVANFLERTLDDRASLRLAHGNSWLRDDFDLRLSPAYIGAAQEDDNPHATVADARSWFASSKQAMLAPYGVGTIDQALQGVVAVKHFFVRRFALAGKVVILDEIHSYDIYTGSLVTALVRELVRLGSTVILLSATLTQSRRRELLSGIGCEEDSSPSAYPLVTVARPGCALDRLMPSGPTSRNISVRCAPIAEEETIAELIARAERGQHVLWIRNTVVEAQESFRHLRSELCAGELTVGLLHSRFPLERRDELEHDWLERLGRNRATQGPGSILIATQVVEQSVDIDLDFIVSDLAPTDMLLQRLGRLWRHPRAQRAAALPEFWIRSLAVAPDETDVRKIKKSLGRSGRVYAPWVLLRSSQVFANRLALTLPDDIRPLLEETYRPPADAEPPGWHDLHTELEGEKERLLALADAAKRVLGLPSRDIPDESNAMTRLNGAPTVPVVLLRNVEPLPGRRHRLTTLDGATIEVSEFEWQLDVARVLHRWLVRVPKWQVPNDHPCPAWLHQHVPGNCTYATVSDQDDRLWFGETIGPCAYRADLGVHAVKTTNLSPQTTCNSTYDDDDEFDY